MLPLLFILLRIVGRVAGQCVPLAPAEPTAPTRYALAAKHCPGAAGRGWLEFEGAQLASPLARLRLVGPAVVVTPPSRMKLERAGLMSSPYEVPLCGSYSAELLLWHPAFDNRSLDSQANCFGDKWAAAVYTLDIKCEPGWAPGGGGYWAVGPGAHSRELLQRTAVQTTRAPGHRERFDLYTRFIVHNFTGSTYLPATAFFGRPSQGGEESTHAGEPLGLTHTGARRSVVEAYRCMSSFQHLCLYGDSTMRHTWYYLAGMYDAATANVTGKRPGDERRAWDKIMVSEDKLLRTATVRGPPPGSLPGGGEGGRQAGGAGRPGRGGRGVAGVGGKLSWFWDPWGNELPRKVKTAQCDAVAVSYGHWHMAGNPGSNGDGAPGALWSISEYKRLLRTVLKRLYVLWKRRDRRRLRHVFLLDSHPAGYGRGMTGCPATDWRNDAVMAAFNKAAQSVAAEFEGGFATFMERYPLADPVADLAYELGHYADPVGEVLAQHFVDGACAAVERKAEPLGFGRAPLNPKP